MLKNSFFKTLAPKLFLQCANDVWVWKRAKKVHWRTRKKFVERGPKPKKIKPCTVLQKVGLSNYIGHYKILYFFNKVFLEYVKFKHSVYHWQQLEKSIVLKINALDKDEA